MEQVPLSMAWFVAAVAAVNVITYGGISWVYFRDKQRVDPPKATAATPFLRNSAFEDPTGATDDRPRELKRAA